MADIIDLIGCLVMRSHIYFVRQKLAFHTWTLNLNTLLFNIMEYIVECFILVVERFAENSISKLEYAF